MNPISMRMESMRTDLAIFLEVSVKYLENSMPAMRGSKRMLTMFMNRSTKLISKSLTLSDNSGMKEEKAKKLRGVMIKANMEVNAVSVTESARFPLASKEKKLEAFPPGQAATSNMPRAMPGSGDRM